MRELEEKRINKEMANIRKKFKGRVRLNHSLGLVLILHRRRKFGRISEEKVGVSSLESCTSSIMLQVCREDHLHIYPRVQSRCGTHGSRQPHIEFQVQ